MIDLLIWFIGSFISTSGFAYLYYRLSDSKVHFSFKIILVMLLGALSLALIKHFDKKTLSFTIYFVFYPILYKLLNPLPLKKVIYFMLAIWIFGCFIDFLLMTLVSLLHHFFTFDIYNAYYESLFTLITVALFLIFAQLKPMKTLINYVYDKLSKIQYINFSLILFSVFVFLLGIVIFLNMQNLNVNVLLVLLVFLVILVFILLIKYKIVQVENIIFLKNLKDNNDFFIKIEDENRIFRHNLNAKLSSIKSVSNKKAIKLIDDLLMHYGNKKFLYHSISSVPYGLNGIVYEHIYPYLSKLNIEIDNTIEYDIFKVLKPRRYNVLVEKIILTLDNAIEASLTSDAKIIVISIFDTKNEIIIKIKNSYNGMLNISELGLINYSTKGKKRGLGLFSMLRDNEVKVSLKISNNIFENTIVVKKIMRN